MGNRLYLTYGEVFMFIIVLFQSLGHRADFNKLGGKIGMLYQSQTRSKRENRLGKRAQHKYRMLPDPKQPCNTIFSQDTSQTQSQEELA